jgi:regulator of protease activity HflC (stomatin/prohibitin superfamily)
MLDRLIDVILQAWNSLMPFEVIDAYQQGVVLRFGKFNRILDPGFHWIWPFNIEKVLSETVVRNTEFYWPQLAITKDGVQIVFSVVMVFRVNDIKKFLLEVEGGINASRDIALGTSRTVINKHTWEEVSSEAFVDFLGKEIRKKSFVVGVEVLQVAFASLGRCGLKDGVIYMVRTGGGN